MRKESDNDGEKDEVQTEGQRRSRLLEPIHVISLGAGVQSSTMALMAAHGEITPMPKCAIFADTGEEPQSVYVWLDTLTQLLPFPIHIATSHHGRLSANLFKGNHSQIPAFMVGTIGKRQCTNHWKLRPIRKEIRRISKGNPVVQWIGISMDEIWRMKPSGVNYIVNRHPLIESRLTRRECSRWLESHGYNQVPKSACIFCPYHSESQWLQFRQSGGYEWDRIVKVDRSLNKRGEFLHPSCVAIDEVPLSDDDRGQQVMFGNECEGMCGV